MNQYVGLLNLPVLTSDATHCASLKIPEVVYALFHEMVIPLIPHLDVTWTPGGYRSF